MFNNIWLYIRRLKATEQRRVIISNFGYMLALKVSGYIFPLITIPYLARVIGVEGFGKIAFAAAVIIWFRTVSDWGFNYTGTRDVAKCRDDIEKVSEVFSSILWARIALASASFVVLIVLINTIPFFYEHRAVLLATFLLVPAQIIFPEWFFQAMEKMRFITYFSLVARTLFTISIFVFINSKDDYVLHPLLFSAGNILCGIVAMYFIIAKWNVKIQMPNVKLSLETIKSSNDVFINNIMPNLYNSFSSVLLGVVGGSMSNGILDAGRKFVDVSVQFVDVISKVFYPSLSRDISNHKIYCIINLAVSLLFAISLFLFSPQIIRLFFTEEFLGAVIVLRIMSVFVVFQSLINIFGVNYLLLQNGELVFRRITFFWSCVGFLISFPLVIFFDAVGAALTITIIRGCIGLSVMQKARSMIGRQLSQENPR